MKRCLISGSFDPITVGHLDVIERATRLCDQLWVALLINGEKTFAFSVEDRLEMIRLATAHLPQVQVTTFQGLLVDLAKQLEIDAVIRGVRGSQDLSGELIMAHTNRQLNPECETLMLPSDPSLSYVSSSMVREVARCGGDYSRWIPEGCRELVQKRFSVVLKRQ